MEKNLKFKDKNKKDIRVDLARFAYDRDPQLKAMGVTFQQFKSMVNVLEKYLEWELTQEEMKGLSVITSSNYTQYAAKDLELLKKSIFRTFQQD